MRSGYETLSDAVARVHLEMGDLRDQIDRGVLHYVIILRAGDVETYESCQGGAGHSYREPTVRFHGNAHEGFRALSWALNHGLPVYALKRIWTLTDGEPTGPSWELVFSHAVPD